MSTSPIHVFGGRSLRIAAQFVLFALWVLVAIAGPSASIAQDSSRPVGPDAITPVEEFSRQLDEFKKSIPELNKKIEDSAASIDRWTDVDKARKEIEDLRALVGAALGAVSDNGVVSQLGVRALDHARNKLRTLEQDNRFKPEEKQFLIDQWRRLKDETERANDELVTARRDFVELLRTLQSNEDFVDELIQIRQAQKALEVIRQLTQEIRGASDQLKRLISGIKPPGA
jgi:DNA repair exonuclease SbcCD ATPase subunit